MKDFPVFTTENGIASLKMREIPYSGAVYITVRDTQNVKALLEDCLGFCRAVGAQTVYACGHKDLLDYPLYTHILELRISRAAVEKADGIVAPVSLDTVSEYRRIYNEKMRDIPAAAYMTVMDERALIEEGNSYFVFQGDRLLGIGAGSGDRIQVIASMVPGAGAEIVKSIVSCLSGENIYLEVASANYRAMKLYERMGFTVHAKKNSWYKIF